MFDPFQMAMYLATRSLPQPIPCLLNTSLCFSESRAHLRVGESCLLEQLLVSLSKLGNSLWSLTEKVHIIQQMNLFKRCIVLYKDTFFFFLVEYQGGMIRIVRKAHMDSVSVSIIDWQHALGMLCKFPDAQFTSHKWNYQQYLPHKAVVSIKCGDSSKGFSTRFNS